MPDLTVARGTLHKGAPCWTLTTDSGETLFVLGDLSKVRDGDTVVAAGQISAQGFCGGPTLVVHWIGTNTGGADALPDSVIRDITVKVTLSSMDLSPRFRLEGKSLALTADGSNWVGYFAKVTVQGKLDIYFESAAWDFQEFTLLVEAVDSTSGKTYKSDFPPVKEKKGYVAISKTLDVGARV
ncbi:hypothetical protein [Longimicrobium sp.]|jgi:hypothetical protein|uniref:hypothetical protein n=1 Tax=Longimicrobium sp. TaxID=2029185 RepID=UPI002ED83D22